MADAIGKIEILHGQATATLEGETRILGVGDDVFEGETISTGGDHSALQIRFADNTVLSQGPDSTLVLDEYVYDPDTGTGSAVLRMTEGTFRSVTGTIVDNNPEAFELKSPLATIGIRGTTTAHTIPGDGSPEQHLVLVYDGKPVAIVPAGNGEFRLIAEGGGKVEMSALGSSDVQIMTRAEYEFYQQFSSQNLGDHPPQYGSPQDLAGQNPDLNAPVTQDELNQGQQGQQQDQGGDDQGDGQNGDEGDEGDEGPGNQADENQADENQGDENQGDENQGDGDGDGDGDEGDGDGDGDGQEHANQGNHYGQGVNDDGSGINANIGLGSEQGTVVITLPDGTVITGSISQAAGELLGGAGGDDLGDDDDGNDDPVPPATSGTTDPGTGVFSLNTDFTTLFDFSDIGGSARVALNALTGAGTVTITPVDAAVAAGSVLTVDASALTAGQNLNFDGTNETDGYYDIQSGAGDDTIKGSDHNPDGDTINGGAGHDSLLGYGGNDVIHGEDGDDTIWGDDGLSGGTGTKNDSLYGDAGADSIMGENGDDLVDGGDGGDWLFGGSGNDTLSYENDAVGVNINLGTGAASGGGSQADGDHISTDFEAVWGGSGDDTLTGTNLDNEIKGNAGADSLDAGTGGDDALYGGAGNDTITVGASLTSADTVDGGSGNDTLNISGNTGTDDLDGVRNVETVILAAGSNYILTPDNDVVAAGRHLDVNGSALGAGDALSFDGGGETNGSFTLTGGSGADALKGGALGDTIDGQAGADDLWGRGGNDIFLFDTGDHTASEYINGGAGTDTIAILSDTTFYQGSGIDEMEVVQIGAGLTGTFEAGVITGQTWTIKGLVGTSETLEVITNGTGSIMDLSGLVQADWEAADALTITGSSSGDTITGWDGDDTIDAGGGNDIIHGSDGNDSIDGGAGTDRLDFTGTTTARTYYFSTATPYTGTITGSTVNFANIEEFRAGDGNDTFEAGYGAYTFKGGGGTDVLDYSNFAYGLTDVWRGSATAGHVKYNPGAEVTHTVETFESIIGTNQADLFRASQWGDTYDGGAGDDTLSYTDMTTSVSVDLKDDGSAALVGGDASDDVVKNFENLVGGAAGDTLKGTSAANSIKGGSGDDWIEGEGGVDTLEGESGDDLFKFHGGAFTGEIWGGGGGETNGDSIWAYSGDNDFTGAVIAGVEALKVESGAIARLDSGTTWSLDLVGAGTVRLDGFDGANDDMNLSMLDLDNQGFTGVLAVDGGTGDDTIRLGGTMSERVHVDGGGGTDTLLFVGGGGTDHWTDLDNVTNVETIQADNSAVDMAIVAKDSLVASGDTVTVNGYSSLTFNFDGSAETDGFYDIKGSVNNDTLIGGDLADTMDANPGDDKITGNGGADSLYGDDGNDTFYWSEGDGADSMDGAGHTDTLVLSGTFSSGATVVDGGSNWLNMTQDGTTAKFKYVEQLEATDKADNITLLYTLVNVKGMAGNDTIDASSATGATVLNGGAGVDSLTGSGNADTFVYNGDFEAGEYVNGGAGTDTLQVNSNTDFSVGGTITGVEFLQLDDGKTATMRSADLAGFSTVAGVTGGSAESLVVQGSGSGDVIDLSGLTLSNWDATNSLTVYGNGGDDTITGSSKSDALHGCDGDDTIITTDGGGDSVYGDAGHDVLDYSGYSAGAVTITYTTTTSGTVNWGAFTDTFEGVEKVIGGAAGNTITGTAGADQLQGADGNDNIDGAAGNDTIFGTLGQDTLNGGADTDTVTFEDLATHAVDLTMGATAGSATAVVNGQTQTITNTEVFVGSDQGDTFTASTNINVTHTLYGGDGNDVFNFNAADELLQQDDVVDGGAGDDTLNFMGGNASFSEDNLQGVRNIEHVVLADADTSIKLNDTTPGQDNDVVASGQTMAIDASALTGGNNLDFQSLAETDGHFDITGSGQADSFYLNNLTGSTSINGAGGNDTLTINDSLNGDETNDLDGVTNVETIVTTGSAFTVTLSNDNLVGAGETLYINGTGCGFSHTLDLSAESDGYFNIHTRNANDSFAFGTHMGGVHTVNGGDFGGYAWDEDSLSYTDDGNAGNRDELNNVTNVEHIILGAADTYLTLVDGFHADVDDVVTIDGSSATLLYLDWSAETSGIANYEVIATAGNDSLVAGYSQDSITAGLGDDTIDMGTYFWHDDTIDGGGGYDVINATLQYYAVSQEYLENVTNVEKVVLGNGYGTLNMTDGSLTGTQTMEIDATAYTSGFTFNGVAESTGGFKVLGGAASDTLLGGGGDDTMVGSALGDSMDGNGGTDVLDYSADVTGVSVDLSTNSTAGSLGGSLADGDTIADFEGVIGGSGDDTLTGNGSGNVLDGGTGSDTITGNAGADTITGGADTDNMYGGDGNDHFLFYGGNVQVGEYINGNDDYDYFYVYGTEDFSTALVYNVECVHLEGALTATFIFTSAANNFDTDWLFYGDSGEATQQILNITMEAGTPLDLSGTTFHDWTAGTDQINITGTTSGDTIIAGTADETIAGGDGNDSITAGNAYDVGTSGDDSINAGDGDDTVVMGQDLTAGDTIAGGTGDDSLVFNSGWMADNSMANVTGFEFFTITGAGSNQIFGDGLVENGKTLAIDATGVNNSSANNFDFSAELDGHIDYTGSTTVSFRDNIIGGQLADTLRGGNDDDSLDGQGGGDKLYGQAGADYLSGGDGDDLLEGGAGGDNLSGGAGTDTISYESDTTGVDINMGSGQTGGDAEGDVIDWASFETLWTGSGNDTVDGSTGADIIYGRDGMDRLAGKLGNDKVYGEAGNDVLYGNGGDDTLEGGAGEDSIFGGTGADSMLGGDDNDIFYLETGGEENGDVFNGEGGTNTLYMRTNIATYDLRTATLTSIQTLDLHYQVTVDIYAAQLVGAGVTTIFDHTTNSTLNIHGTTGADSIDLGSMAFTGEWDSNDHINYYGYAGNDTITGSAERESISGGDDNDVITGGDGKDTINGDAGDDILVFNTGDVDSGELIDGGAGTDTVRVDSDVDFTAVGSLTGISVLDINGTSTATFDWLDFAGAGILTVSGDTGDQVLELMGTTGDDVMNAGGLSMSNWDTGGGDQVYFSGGDGDDLITGTSRPNIFEGGDGADTMNGGTGNDLFLYNTTTDSTGDSITANTGDDSVAVNCDLNFRDVTFSGVEHFNLAVASTLSLTFAQAGAYTGNFTGQTGSSEMISVHAETGGDTFDLSSLTLTDWEAGTDVLQAFGGDGDDSLTGSSGIDYLMGDAWVGSTFDLSTEHWRGGGDAGAMNHIGTGGNPGGYTSEIETQTGGEATFISPEAWAGDWSNYVGATLSWDIYLDSGTVTQGDDNAWVKVWDTLGNSAIAYVGTAPTLDTWTSYSIALTDGNFAATGDTFANIMAHFSHLEFEAEWGTAQDKVGIDNVLVSAATSGADTLDGGDGADYLYGGAGNDSFLFSAGDADTGEIIDGGAGTDVLDINGTVDMRGATIMNIEAIDLSGTSTGQFYGSQVGNWTLYGDGDTQQFAILDTSADSVIDLSSLSFDGSWTEGVDLISIDGGGGNDTITGSSYADRISAGQWGDTITGGGGDDLFIYSGPTDGGDTITDFDDNGNDTFQFDHTGFGLAGTTQGTHWAFEANTVATGSIATFLFDAATDTLYFDSDGSGSNAAVAIANVDDATLDIADISVV